MQQQIKLTYLWIFILFNIIFRDLHEIPTKEFLSEALTGAVNGTVLTEPLMLFGALIAELTIMMVLVARFTAPKLNRLLNLIVATIITLFFISVPRTDLDDWFFAGVKICTLCYILWYAYHWKTATTEQTSDYQTT